MCSAVGGAGVSIERMSSSPSELDGDQTKAEELRILPRFGPLGRVKTYVLLV
jgi:hypothetical protein